METKKITRYKVQLEDREKEQVRQLFETEPFFNLFQYVEILCNRAYDIGFAKGKLEDLKGE